MDGVIATEAELLSQTSSISNDPLGDLDHVKLVMQVFKFVDCLSQPWSSGPAGMPWPAPPDVSKDTISGAALRSSR
jgi:hypothetical protein